MSTGTLTYKSKLSIAEAADFDFNSDDDDDDDDSMMVNDSHETITAPIESELIEGGPARNESTDRDLAGSELAEREARVASDAQQDNTQPPEDGLADSGATEIQRDEMQPAESELAEKNSAVGVSSTSSVGQLPKDTARKSLSPDPQSRHDGLDKLGEESVERSCELSSKLTDKTWDISETQEHIAGAEISDASNGEPQPPIEPPVQMRQDTRFAIHNLLRHTPPLTYTEICKRSQISTSRENKPASVTMSHGLESLPSNAVRQPYSYGEPVPPQSTSENSWRESLNDHTSVTDRNSHAYHPMYAHDGNYSLAVSQPPVPTYQQLGEPARLPYATPYFNPPSMVQQANYEPFHVSDGPVCPPLDFSRGQAYRHENSDQTTHPISQPSNGYVAKRRYRRTKPPAPIPASM
jgi:hypothetical protein